MHRFIFFLSFARTFSTDGSKGPRAKKAKARTSLKMHRLQLRAEAAADGMRPVAAAAVAKVHHSRLVSSSFSLPSRPPFFLISLQKIERGNLEKDLSLAQEDEKKKNFSAFPSSFLLQFPPLPGSI